MLRWLLNRCNPSQDTFYKKSFDLDIAPGHITISTIFWVTVQHYLTLDLQPLLNSYSSILLGYQNIGFCPKSKCSLSSLDLSF